MALGYCNRKCQVNISIFEINCFYINAVEGVVPYVCSRKGCIGQHRIGKVASAQLCLGKIRPLQIGIGKIHALQLLFGKIGIIEPCVAPVAAVDCDGGKIAVGKTAARQLAEIVCGTEQAAKADFAV